MIYTDLKIPGFLESMIWHVFIGQKKCPSAKIRNEHLLMENHTHNSETFKAPGIQLYLN